MDSLTSIGVSRAEGISLASVGGDTYIAQMKSGRQFRIHQEDWSVKTDYYLDTFVYHLEEIISDLQQSGNPLRRVLEIGVARGVLSIGIALITGDKTRIVGVDIEEKSKQLVAQNAAHNEVAHKIEVRIGNLFEPVQRGETFDLIFGELPMMAIDPKEQQAYIEQGYRSEILNISGGPDGRYFIDALIEQGPTYLNPGGVLLLIQPSFIDVDKTLEMLARQGLRGEVMVSREWLLSDTKFARRNKNYLEKVHNYTFPKNREGEEVFYLTIIKGVMPA